MVLEYFTPDIEDLWQESDLIVISLSQFVIWAIGEYVSFGRMPVKVDEEMELLSIFLL